MADELQRMKSINLQLLRKLHACRAEVVEECARFCEENAQLDLGDDVISRTASEGAKHYGNLYAAGLRGLIRR